MVWGAFAKHGVGDLVRIQGIMDKDLYNTIIDDHAVPSYDRLFPLRDGIFQQDNDPKHTSKKCKRAIQRLANQGRFTIMEWPPQSPDLNPIENLWSILESRMKDRQPNSEDELHDVVNDAWDNLPRDLLEGLVNSMHDRCQAVIENNGYATKY